VETTKLQQYLTTHRIAASTIERTSGIPRASFCKMRRGRDVRLSTMKRILRAVRIAGRTDAVQMGDLFDLEPDVPPILDVDPRE
jgi:predicted transcriptional regulator